MKKVKVKIPAKINLTLDILGVKDGYHVLESLVASIDLFDTVVAKKRSDSKINLKFRGIPVGINSEKSNAYRAAEKFIKEFSTTGADITVKRDIPAAAGLGGSSADIAGVLNAMKELYCVDGDVTEIANSLGSDVAYMLKGGYAVIKNRGEIVERLDGIKNVFYLLIVTGTEGVSTAESYKTYDKLSVKHEMQTPVAVDNLIKGDKGGFLTALSNDLYEGSALLLPEIKETVTRLSEFGSAVMTGSGSAVYGIYKTEEERDRVYKALRREYGKRLIKAKTL